MVRDNEAEFRSPEQEGGYMAGIEGLSKSENPWSGGTREFMEWSDGWAWADSLREAWYELQDLF